MHTERDPWRHLRCCIRVNLSRLARPFWHLRCTGRSQASSRVHQPPLEPCPGMDAGGLVIFLAYWWWRLTVGALAHAPRPSHLGLGMPAALKTLLWYGCGVAGLCLSSWSWRCLTSGCGGSRPMAFTLGSLGVAGRWVRRLIVRTPRGVRRFVVRTHCHIFWTSSTCRSDSPGSSSTCRSDSQSHHSFLPIIHFHIHVFS